MSSQMPQPSLPTAGVNPPSPTYSPNSESSSPRSASIRGNSFQITQVLGYSSTPNSEPSTPSPELAPSSPTQDAQYASMPQDSLEEKQKSPNRYSGLNENGFPDEKKRRSFVSDFRRSFLEVDVKDLGRPINYSYIGTIVSHVILVSMENLKKCPISFCLIVFPSPYSTRS